jgi:hypothetical protein
MRCVTTGMIIGVLLIAAVGCGDGDRQAAKAPQAPMTQPAPTNRIDVPASVRQNLGVTFAKVERRRVASTIRVPGRFELQPSARREYRSTLPGWVHLRVNEYDQVKKDAPVAELESPEWHKLRQQLHESQVRIEAATAELAVAEQTKIEAEKAAETIAKRIETLAGAEVRRAELESDLTTRRNSIPRLDAEIRVKQAAFDEAKHDFGLQVDTAAALLGLPAKTLIETVNGGDAHGDDLDHKVQRWYTIKRVTLTAAEAGVVESLSSTGGTWVDANTLVATVIDPSALRFRATALQSDLGRLKDGLTAVVTPPAGTGIDAKDVVAGTLKIGLAGDPDQRTIELLMTPVRVAAWAKPGVSSTLEIVTEGGTEELAIPASAVVRDELTHIFFRRDPANPDKVIRMEADLGVSDGKWVVVKSGVKEGDEVVLDGVYELKLAGGGKPTGGGHFHADGSFHAEPDK